MPTPALSPRLSRLLNRAAFWFALAAIVGVAAYLRFGHLRTSPGWYSDEGHFIDYAANLSRGQWQIFPAVGAPMLIGRPPLFLFVLTAAFKFFGTDILVLRQGTAAYGVLGVLLLGALGREMFGARLALLSAGILAICPWVVTYNRLGLTYNQLSPLLLLTLYAGWKFTQGRRAGWAWAACVAAALAFGTDVLGSVAVLTVLLVFLIYDRRWLLPGIALMGLVFGLLLAPVVAANPALFMGDVRAMVLARGGDSPLFLQLANVVLNYGEWLRRESWMALGLCGLFLLPAPRARALVLFAAGATLLIVTRTLAPVGRGLHYLIPLFPLFALGLAAFIDRAAPRLLQVLEGAFNGAAARLPSIRLRPGWRRLVQFGQKLAISLILFGVLVNPFVWMLFTTLAQSEYGMQTLFTGNDDLNLTSAQDADRVLAYLRQHTSADDLVVASPQIVWGVSAQKSDFYYLPESHLGSVDWLTGRYAYPVSLQRAAYVVLDPLARDFAPLVLPNMHAVIDEVEAWPLAFQAGPLSVYQQPAPKP